MKQKKDPGMEIVEAKELLSLLEKKRQSLDSSSSTGKLLDRFIKDLKYLERNHSVYEFSFFVVLGPRIVFRFKALELVLDLRNKVWAKLKKTYN